MATTLSSNLVRLRTAGGWTQAEVANNAGISRQAYRALEAGESEPRGRTLMALAAALEVPTDDLLRPARELHAVRFRADKRLLRRGQVLAEVARWLDDYDVLEELLDARRKPPLSLGRRADVKDPVALAARTRKKLKLDSDLIRDICGLLEDNGIKVYRPRVHSDHFFGMCVGTESGGPAVVVNTWDRITVERWIFSAAHELGHLLMHLDAFNVEETSEDEQQEAEADLFASHFLMPNEVFKKEWDDARGLPLVDRVFKLKQMFHVSYKTVLYRVQQNTDDDGIWRKFFRDYKRQHGKVPDRKEEPSPLDEHDFNNGVPAAKVAREPARLPEGLFMEDRLARLVRRAVEEDHISLSRAAEILRLSTRDMRAIAAGWTD